jgi:hypothetical protein
VVKTRAGRSGAQRHQLRIAEPDGQGAQVRPDQPASVGAADPALTLDRGKSPDVVPQTDRVEGVQRIRGYAQPSADRLQYPRALKHGHLPPLLPQRHCRGQSAYTRAYHRRAPGPAARHVGLRRLTHRAVDQAAGLPPGTTSNYARTRAALLTLTLTRIAELDAADSPPGLSELSGPRSPMPWRGCCTG